MADLTHETERFRINFTPEQLANYSRDLGVARAALEAMGCGVATRAEMGRLRVGFGEGEIPSEALTIPERNATGGVIGCCFRAADARKGAATGAKRGLVFSTRMERPSFVLVVEGPSDVAAGFTLGLSTVGRPSNSSGGDLLAEMPSVRDAELFIVADNDASGIDGARKLARKLATTRKKPVRWAPLPNGCKDLRAYLHSLELDPENRESCTAAGLRLLGELKEHANTEEPEQLTTCFADIDPRPLRWRLYPCVPRGKIGLVAGHPGLGKSLVTLDMGARLSRGEGMPGERNPDEACDVLFLSAEDDPHDTIRPRLDAAGANVERVHASACLDLLELEKMLIERPRVGLVVIDPLSAYTGDIDTHRDAEVRTFLARVAELARERDVAIFFVVHLRKSSDGPAILKPGGSIAFVAAARIAWIVLEDPSDKQRRYFLPLKSNLGPDSRGWAYRIESDGPDCPPRVAWDDEIVTASADAIIARASRSQARAGSGEALAEAVAFLEEHLADGPCESAEVFAAAKAHGISKATVRRAKAKLPIRVAKSGMEGGWTWELEKSEPDAAAESTNEEAQGPLPGMDEPLRDERRADEAGGFCDASDVG